jgi:membrane-associated protease RseP (regulator of RpoE activity)
MLRRMTESGASSRRIQLIAVGFAGVALATAIAAAVVVATRSAPDKAPLVDERRIAAAELWKLDPRDHKDAVTVSDDGARVADAELRKTLGLDEGDAITAISGHPIKRDNDLHDALLHTSSMSVTALYVELVHAHQPVLRRWTIDGDLRRGRPSSASSSFGTGTYIPPPPASPVPVDPDPLAASVTQIDDTHYEIPRATVDQVLTDPLPVARAARIVPSMRDGRANGFKLYAIRPSSLYAALGFRNGDTILAVNGESLTDMSQGLALYTKLKDSSVFEVEIDRRGTRVDLTITIK